MAKCELICHECRIKDCGLRSFNAFDSKTPNPTVDALMKGRRSKAQLHVRIDAKEAARRVRGQSGGGVGIGVPPAIETNPEQYMTDQLKAEENIRN